MHFSKLQKKLQIQTVHDLIAPTADSIIAGLNRDSSFKEHLGKTIFILGASNMEQLTQHLLELSESTGVKVVPLCEGGDFLKFFLEHPNLLEVLKIGKPDDLLFFNPIGNLMISYQEKEKKRGGWHLKNPKIMSDQRFNQVMVDVNHAVSVIHQVFRGTSFLMGPYPRMLRDCCMEEAHWLRDYEGHRIDMLLLTDIITDHMHRAAALPDNFGFVSYKEVFGKHKFNVSMLSDNVHLENPAQRIVANFMLQWFDKNSPVHGKLAEGETLVPLSEACTMEKIITGPGPLEDDVFENPGTARRALDSIDQHNEEARK